jgi:hypothetical protein
MYGALSKILDKRVWRYASSWILRFVRRTPPRVDTPFLSIPFLEGQLFSLEMVLA